MSDGIGRPADKRDTPTCFPSQHFGTAPEADMEDEVERARQRKIEREKADRDDLAEDMRKWRPFRIIATLGGVGTSTLPQAYADLIDLLRSGDPLDQDLRNELADALVRGQTDGAGVRLRIEAQGQYFKSMASIDANDRLLDAGLYIARERKKEINGKKRTFSAIYRDLPSKFHIDDAADYGQRARNLYDLFRQWAEVNSENLFDADGCTDIHSYEDHDEDDDVFDMAKSEFLHQHVPVPLPELKG